MPRHLLATAQMVELGLLARRREPGLRTATETFHGAAALCALLAFFDRRAKLSGEIPQPASPPELRPAVESLARAM